MAHCEEGHETTAADFCDQCGMPVVEGVEVEPEPTQAVETHCPNCAAIHQVGDLFCEACGYDYTTGALPTQSIHAELGLEEPEVAAPPESEEAAEVESGESGEPAESTDVTEPAKAPPPVAKPRGKSTKTVPWVAEVWIDPQWYASQDTSDLLPPLGPPRIITLGDSALIGRRSISRNIHPDIDCELDTGCSRRQAYLTSADGYWYVNDLDSANGTYVGLATGSLPEDPIAGRTQVGPDQRIYVGAWTRIVLRPAIAGETTAT
ncbi:MAG: FHA domain-containing protein [Propionibacteriaceae bacterium]|jgi:uncharacterized Zn finger protein (UPF0148 family)|nr:FHA domain-containing protein [Propionibacteriaceae bacterium]